jgi:hypothetical protein
MLRVMVPDAGVERAGFSCPGTRVAEYLFPWLCADRVVNAPAITITAKAVNAV